MKQSEKIIHPIEKKINRFFRDRLETLYALAGIGLLLLYISYVVTADRRMDNSINAYSAMFEEDSTEVSKTLANIIEKPDTLDSLKKTDKKKYEKHKKINNNFKKYLDYNKNRFLYTHAFLIFFFFSGLVLIYLFKSYRNVNSGENEESEYGIFWFSAAILIWILSTTFQFYFSVFTKVVENNIFFSTTVYSFSIINTLLIWIATTYITIKKISTRKYKRYLKYNNFIFRNNNLNLILRVLALIAIILVISFLPQEYEFKKLLISLINLIFSFLSFFPVFYILIKVSKERELTINQIFLIILLTILIFSQVTEFLRSIKSFIPSNMLNFVSVIDEILPVGPAMQLIFVTTFIIIIFSWLYEKVKTERQRNQKLVGLYEKERSEKLINQSEMSHTIKGGLTYLDRTINEEKNNINEETSENYNFVETLENMQRRIGSMVLLYDSIHQNPNPNPELIGFIESVIERIEASLNQNKVVEFIYPINKKIFVELSRARKIGQAITELCINSMHAAKHNNIKIPSIRIEFKKLITKQNQFIEINYLDNCGGINMEENIKIVNNKFTSIAKGGFGLELILGLIQKIGEIEGIRTLNDGTEYVFRIPLKVIQIQNTK